MTAVRKLKVSFKKALVDNRQRLAGQSTSVQSASVGGVSEKQARIAALRSTLAGLEHKISPATELVDPIGSDIPTAPAGDLFQEIMADRALHGLCADSVCHHGALTGVLASHLKSQSGPVFWVMEQAVIREHGLPYGPGLLALGFDPGQIFMVRTGKRLEALWAMEEILKTGQATAVVGEVSDISLLESRRLTLAARAGDTAAYVLSVGQRQAPSPTAYSRWKVETIDSEVAGDDAALSSLPGQARARLTLTKHKGGRPPVTMTLSLDDATDSLSPSADVAAGAALACA